MTEFNVLVKFIEFAEKPFKSFVESDKFSLPDANKLFIILMAENKTEIAKWVYQCSKKVDLRYGDDSPIMAACVSGNLDGIKFIYENCSSLSTEGVGIHDKVLFKIAEKYNHKHIILWLDTELVKKIDKVDEGHFAKYLKTLDTGEANKIEEIQFKEINKQFKEVADCRNKEKDGEGRNKEKDGEGRNKEKDGEGRNKEGDGDLTKIIAMALEKIKGELK